jgi:exosortase
VNRKTAAHDERARPAERTSLIGDRIARLPHVRHRSEVVQLTALAAATLLVYWSVIEGLVHQWASDDSYSHGFLIAPLAIYFAWRRRDDLISTPRFPSAFGVAVAAAAMCLWAAGTAAAELFVTRASLVLFVAGCVLFLYGWAWLRLLAFPIAFLLLMIPLPAIVFNQIALPLQLLASQIGEATLRAGGVPVLRDGNVLELVGLRLEVAEACSGIRSIMALLTFALVVGHLGRCSAMRLAGLALATVPIAIAANAARVVATGFAANVWGPVVAQGLLHTAAGGMVFMAGVLMLVTLERLTRSHYELAEQV